jgi:hypothetical protein
MATSAATSRCIAGGELGDRRCAVEFHFGETLLAGVLSCSGLGLAMGCIGLRRRAVAAPRRPRRRRVAVPAARRPATGQPRRDVLANPERIPPLDRIDVHAAQHDREVQVVAAGQSGFAGLTQRFAGFHLLARLHGDGAQVAVQRGNAQAVIDDHGVAVDAEVVGIDDDAILCGFDRRVLQRREVVAGCVCRSIVSPL